MELIDRKSILTNLSYLKKLPLISKFSPSSIQVPLEKDLQGFRDSQKLAYNCAVEAAQFLKVGMSEKRIASWMQSYLLDFGVDSGFHQPLAWFGERSRFKGIRSESDALPSNRKLASETEPVILDLAPILDGYVSDIGFSFSLAPNSELIASRKFLLEMRKLLPELFASERKVSTIWAEVDDLIKERGYQNCHSKYIMSVLGHRVYKIPYSSQWPQNYLGMYSLKAYWALSSRGFFPELLSPYHKGEKIGLWAVEPHIGNRDTNFGSKFEEILVVEKDKAYWLEDSVPHLKLPKGLF